MPGIRFRRHVLVTGALVGLVLAGVAGGGTSTVFPDRIGDAGTSLDLTGFQVSSGGGGVEFWATVSPDSTWCRGEGGDVPLLVAVDTDQNPDTGSAFYGTEVEFAFEPSGASQAGEGVFLRAHGWDFRGAPLPEGFSWGCGPKEGGYGVGPAALGLAPNAGFNVVVATQGPRVDTAPDIRTFNYQQVPGTTPPTPGPDARAPHVIAYSASATRGKVATLTYWTLDGRGKTADTIRIFHGARLLKTIQRPLRDSNPFRLSHVRWRMPRGVHGRLRFSVRSADAAGNTSRAASARLVLR